MEPQTPRSGRDEPPDSAPTGGFRERIGIETPPRPWYPASSPIDLTETAAWSPVGGTSGSLGSGSGSGSGSQAGDSGGWDPPQPGIGPPRGGMAIARFELIERRARGGLGEIYLANDVELGRYVAVKVLRSKHADDPMLQRRFRREAEITGRLEHPGIVPVYGLGLQEAGRLSYAMRYIHGRSLREAIRAFHALPRHAPGRDLELRRLLGHFVEVCNAIAYAHAQGIIHRDLKPSNVMLGDFGETLVVDWGLAKPWTTSQTRTTPPATTPHPQEREHDPNPAHEDAPPPRPNQAGPLPIAWDEESWEQTQAGTTLGTPETMSPEQAGAVELGPVGPASDIYGLGATLAILLTDRPPVQGETVQAILENVKRGRILPPRAVDPTIPRALEAIVLKAMARRPEDRHPTARALAEDVERWLADLPPSWWREPLPDRLKRSVRRHRAAALAAALILAVLTASLAALAWIQSRARERLETTNQALRLARADEELARRRATERFRKAIEALDALNQRVAEEPRLDTAQLADLRGELLKMTLDFHDRIREQLRRETELGTAETNRDRLDVWRTRGLDPVDREALELLADSLTRIGSLRTNLGLTNEAAEAFDQAIELRECLCALRPLSDLGNPTPVLKLAQAHLARGYVFRDVTSQRDRARSDFERVVELVEPLTRSGATLEEALHLEANALKELGNVHQLNGVVDQAEALLSRAVAAAVRLVEQFPGTPRHRETLATARHDLALLLLKDGRDEEAVEQLAEATRLIDDLAQSQPRRLDGYRIIIHFELARALMELGDFKAAEAQAEGFAPQLDAFTDRRERSVPLLLGLSESWATLADLRGLRGHHAGASLAWERCNQAARQLRERAPTSPLYATWLVRCLLAQADQERRGHRPERRAQLANEARSLLESPLGRLVTDAERQRLRAILLSDQPASVKADALNDPRWKRLQPPDDHRTTVDLVIQLAGLANQLAEDPDLPPELIHHLNDQAAGLIRLLRQRGQLARPSQWINLLVHPDLVALRRRPDLADVLWDHVLPPSVWTFPQP